MAKGKTTVFFCQQCGFESSKWMGQCPGCKEWNTFVEELVDKKSISSSGRIDSAKRAEPIPLSAIDTTEEVRMSTGIKELDRVLGGGIVKGALMLVEEIRELENPPCCSRCAGTLRRLPLMCSISRGRNLCSRLR